MQPDRPTTPDADARRLAAIGTVVRRYRKAAKMTQDALDEAASVDVTHVRAIEAGRRNPSILVLWSLADGMGVPLDVLCAEVVAEVRADSAGGRARGQSSGLGFGSGSI